MADNYLEKRYENYLAKKAAWERSKKMADLKRRIKMRAETSKDTNR